VHGEKHVPQATFSITNLIWIDLESNPHFMENEGSKPYLRDFLKGLRPVSEKASQLSSFLFNRRPRWNSEISLYQDLHTGTVLKLEDWDGRTTPQHRIEKRQSLTGNSTTQCQ
jgi:hypothetical protein